MANTYNIPNPCAKLIGIFLGTDMALLPGDSFAKIFDLGRNHLDFRELGFFNHRRSVQAREGLSIQKYRVVRLTACFAYVHRIAEYRYYKVIMWGNPVVATDYWFYRAFDDDFEYRRGMTYCQNDRISPETAESMRGAAKIDDFRDIMFDRSSMRLVNSRTMIFL